MADPDDIRMSLGDHLEDLRKRLFLGLVGPIIFAIGLMFIAYDIVSFLCIPLLRAMKAVGQTPALYQPQVGDAFGVYLRVAMIGGIILGIPWLLWHLWQFISPGLYPHERKYIVALMPGSAALAVLGSAFMYYIMLPFTLWFLIGFANTFPMPSLERNWIDDMIGTEPPQVVGDPDTEPLVLPRVAADPGDPSEGQMWINTRQNELRIMLGGEVRQIAIGNTSLLTPQLHIGEYISFVMWMALAFAFAFQLPLVMLGLGFTGLVTHAGMAGVRKYAMLGCFMIGAILTPADVISMFALAVPLYVLYEFGLLLVKTFAEREEGTSE